MSDETVRFDASQIKVLEWPEAVRRRPGMYIGSTGERGLHQLVFEVADQAVHEALTGRAGRVDIRLTADGGVRVADNGPGIPIEDDDRPGLTSLLTRLCLRATHRGRHEVHLSRFGLGPSVANALSSRLTAEVHLDGTRWTGEYARGVAVSPLTAVGPTADSGTVITFRPDPEIFHTVEFSFDTLADRFRELAFLNRPLDVSLTGERRSLRLRFPGGARDFVAFLDEPARTAVHHSDVIGFERDDPQMEGTMEIAFRWSHSPEERIRGFANSLATRGGTHLEGFRDGVVAAVTSHARAHGRFAAAERVTAGLTAVVSVKLDQIELEGACRDVLGNGAVRTSVRRAVEEELSRWLADHPEQARALVERAQ
ncbi:ATP-binding protein [Streptacidiphilus rugosus]|uniref:ATP-binding protein n=1 Tax=Streptacidiphilus rugosus TaxID=405783 RepID=UPI00055C9C9B|nr:ATP-binding protein [Streptacidiphilus rugosus]